MNSLAALFLLILPCLCQANALPGSWPGANAVAFIPRGGAIGGGRKGRTKAIPPQEKLDNTDSISSPESEDDNSDGDDGDSEESTPFDLEEVSKQLQKEEVAEIKKSQKFLQKQQQRRDLDKTWLDKGITGVIEFFENLFRWEVIDY